MNIMYLVFLNINVPEWANIWKALIVKQLKEGFNEPLMFSHQGLNCFLVKILSCWLIN